jgi:hypothetical protein
MNMNKNNRNNVDILQQIHVAYKLAVHRQHIDLFVVMVSSMNDVHIVSAMFVFSMMIEMV